MYLYQIVIQSMYTFIIKQNPFINPFITILQKHFIFT